MLRRCLLVLSVLLFSVVPLSAFRAQDIHTLPDIVKIRGDTDSVAVPIPPPVDDSIQPLVTSIMGVYLYPIDSIHAIGLMMTRERHIIILALSTQEPPKMLAVGNWAPIGITEVEEFTPSGPIHVVMHILGVLYVQPEGKGFLLFGFASNGRPILQSPKDGTIFYRDDRYKTPDTTP